MIGEIEEKNLSEVLSFFNGKVPPKDGGDVFLVYGSNGVIGTSNLKNHSSAIILGRVGAYCGSVEICEQSFWASDNTIVVKPQDGFDLKYLYYKLKSMPLNSYAGGSGSTTS